MLEEYKMQILYKTHQMFLFVLPCMVAGLSYYLSIKRAPEENTVIKAVYEEEFQRAAAEDEDRVALNLTPDIKYLRV